MTTITPYLRLLKTCTFITCLLTSTSLYATGISIIFSDNEGQPVEDAVFTLTPTGEVTSQVVADTTPAIMVQNGKQFYPHVLPVRTGTSVSFPNKDDLLHHVYSFTKTKRFEISLYAGTPVNPLQFDKSGVVPLGCNIHDWMLAYIYVTDAPYFTKSNNLGVAVIHNIPAGQYQLQIWHPRIKDNKTYQNQTISVTNNITTNLKFTLQLKRNRRLVEPDDYYGDSDY